MKDLKYTNTCYKSYLLAIVFMISAIIFKDKEFYMHVAFLFICWMLVSIMIDIGIYFYKEIKGLK